MNVPTQALSLPKHLIKTIGYASTITNTTFLPSILATLDSSNNATHARQLFDEFPQKTSLVYNRMFRCYTRNQQPIQALQLFLRMISLGQPRPDHFTYPLLLKACADSSLLNTGSSIHSRVLITGFDSNAFVVNSLLAMYMNCAQTDTAKQVFDGMVERTVVSWNTMISGYVTNGLSDEAVRIFDRMMDEGVVPDHATVVSVLPACASLKDLQRGRRVHELIKRKGIGGCKAVWNSLVSMYAKCGCLSQARKVFDEMNERDVISWTALIGGYALNDDGKGALALCLPMQLDGIRPNSVTIVSLLSACISLSDFKNGKCIHGWIMRYGHESDVIVETSLIDLYAKCNCMDLSIRVFLKTSRRKTAPWNAIISGCVHNWLNEKAIEMFKQMQVEIVEPDAATLMSLLPAYADLADLQQAKNIHCYLIRSGFLSRIETYTSLIDIYSKCGSLDFAHDLFKMLDEKDKDIFTWSTIISGYGMHGHGEVAISLFYQMVQAGIEPNDVTFTSVLHACSHAGLVDDGLRLFKTMVMDYRRRPRMDHYTCIIDLVGRAGRLNDAYNLIVTMPMESNHAVWGALLGACVIHQNVELGEVAAKRLFELEPDKTGNYILLSKLYSAVGRWEDAENLRSMMSDRGLIKTPGCSLIEV